MIQKPALLLLHGALGTERDFDIIRILATSHFNVFSFDFIAHGKQSSNKTEGSIEVLGRQIIHFIEENNLIKPIILGYSMGGYAVLHAALNGYENIGAIITVGTKFLWNDEISQKESKLIEQEHLKTNAPSFLEKLIEVHGDPFYLHTIEFCSQLMLGLGAQIGLKEKFQSFDSFNIPVLFVIGDRDRMVTLNETVEMYSCIEGSEFCVLPGSGHQLYKTNIELLIKVIFDFTFRRYKQN